MRVFGIWCVICALGSVGPSLCVNEAEYEEDYGDSYDNEISEDQQEGESPTTPCHTDVARWEKLFIALEDSHMRQNALLESLEQCSGGIASLTTRVDKLAKGACQRCVPDVVSACRAQADQASVRMHHSLKELREEEEEREKRINVTLQMILHSRHEENAGLALLEEESAPADDNMAQEPTQKPGSLGRVISTVMKLIPYRLKGKEATSQVDMVTMKRELVAIATELQRAHLELRKVIEQAGLRDARGDA